MRLIKKYNFLNIIYKNAISYPCPPNLNLFWNFGSLALFALIIQIISGIFLAMHYVPHTDLAFLSVELHIMREVSYGWFIRYIHSNGASFFFIVVYIHILRGLYYGSYLFPRQLLWIIGVIILFLMIITAFLGYVLPWGQMSYWAATVITSLVSTIPFIGSILVEWLWGGYSVTTITLNRFYSLHYLLPFIILALVIFHLIVLHEDGSNNPLGVDLKEIDTISFHPYYTIKDFYGVLIYLYFFMYFIFFNPNYFSHPDNAIPANPGITPAHIVPEWYLLIYYAILRSVPNKLIGVILLILSILVLILFPFLMQGSVRSAQFKPFYKFFFWFFVINCVILGWIGGLPIKDPFYRLSQFCTIFYFFYLLIILPVLNIIDDLSYGLYEIKLHNKIWMFYYIIFEVFFLELFLKILNYIKKFNDFKIIYILKDNIKEKILNINYKRFVDFLKKLKK